MVKLVTSIPRIVAGRTINPGEEFDVDEKTANVLTQSGHAEASKGAAAPKQTAAVPQPAKAEPAEAPKKSATEVKPISTQQTEQPQPGEYATRELKAKG